jgi:dihydropteroate synthase
MHMPDATPATMQEHTDDYGEDIVTHIWDFLAHHLVKLRGLGMHDVIVDPGFGFGKTTAQNYRLLANLHAFTHLGAPVLAGMSRKGMLYRPLKTDPAGALAATAAVNLYALQQGAAILRVHDVKEGVEVVKLYRLLDEAEV